MQPQQQRPCFCKKKLGFPRRDITSFSTSSTVSSVECQAFTFRTYRRFPVNDLEIFQGRQEGVVSSLSPQFLSTMNTACNKLLECHIYWYHTDRHEQWKRVTYIASFYFVQGLGLALVAKIKVSPPTTGLEKGQ